MQRAKRAIATQEDDIPLADDEWSGRGHGDPAPADLPSAG